MRAPYLTPILDPFFVGETLAFDKPDWQIFWNKKQNRYEVHNVQKQASLVSVLPFLEIDPRTTRYLAKSSGVRRMIEKVEEHNAELDRKHAHQRENALEHALQATK